MLKSFVILVACWFVGFLPAAACPPDSANFRPLLRYLEKQKEKKNKKFIFNLDARSSFISSKAVRIGGIRIGLQYDNDFRVGIGLYFLTSPFERPFTLHKGTGQEQVVAGQLDFAYWGFYYERIWFHSKRWELSSPFVVGLGGASYYYKDEDMNEVTLEEGGVLLIETSFIAVYKFWNFFGIGAGVGLRLAAADEEVRDNLTAPIYLFKIKIFLGQLAKAVFTPKSSKEDAALKSWKR